MVATTQIQMEHCGLEVSRTGKADRGVDMIAINIKIFCEGKRIGLTEHLQIFCVYIDIVQYKPLPGDHDNEKV